MLSKLSQAHFYDLSDAFFGDRMDDANLIEGFPLEILQPDHVCITGVEGPQGTSDIIPEECPMCRKNNIFLA